MDPDVQYDFFIQFPETKSLRLLMDVLHAVLSSKCPDIVLCMTPDSIIMNYENMVQLKIDNKDLEATHLMGAMTYITLNLKEMTRVLKCFHSRDAVRMFRINNEDYITLQSESNGHLITFHTKVIRPPYEPYFELQTPKLIPFMIKTNDLIKGVKLVQNIQAQKMYLHIKENKFIIECATESEITHVTTQFDIQANETINTETCILFERALYPILKSANINNDCHCWLNEHALIVEFHIGEFGRLMFLIYSMDV